MFSQKSENKIICSFIKFDCFENSKTDIKSLNYTRFLSFSESHNFILINSMEITFLWDHLGNILNS